MGADDDAVPAAVGVSLVVVLRRKPRDLPQQLFGKRLPLARGTKADLNIGGKRRQRLPRLLGDGLGLANLLRHTRGEGDQAENRLLDKKICPIDFPTRHCEPLGGWHWGEAISRLRS